MRLIDADALEAMLREQAEHQLFWCREERMHFCDKVMFAIDCISDAPTIDVQPVRRGEWEELVWDDEYDNRKRRSYRCSRCYKQNAVRGNFCPNCGADMRKVSE